MQNPYPSIALVDTSYLFAVNWHAQVKSAQNNAGADTLRQIGRVRQTVGHIICCIDMPPYARKTLFADYKAGREDPGPAYYKQRNWLIEQLDIEGFQVAGAQGFEADDIVATLSVAYRLVCDDIRIVSADKDSYQLVNHKVRMFVPAIAGRPEKVIDEDKVVDITGVKPSLMVDWQGLVGDAGDNVPGCKDIGPKTAAKLLGKYGSIDGIYRAMATPTVETVAFIGKAHYANLKEQRAAVLLSRQLVQLQTNAPVDVSALLEPKKASDEKRAPLVSAPSDSDADDSMFITRNETPAPLPPLPLDGDDGYMPTDEEEQQARDRDRRERTAPPPSLDPAQVISPPPPPAAPPLPDPKATERLHEAKATREAEAAAGPVRPRKTKPRQDEHPSDGGEQLVVDATPATSIVMGPGYGLALEPRNMTQAVWVAQQIEAASLFPKLRTWQAHLAIMMVGREMGLSTMAALMNFELVEGRPTPRWQLIMACAVQHPECEYFVMIESDDEHATFETKRRRNPQVDTYTYTIDMARQAQLVKPGSGYDKHPAALIRKMCCVHLARVTYPDSKAMGLYFPEELGVEAA
jgi:5'-3' exonuclease